MSQTGTVGIIGGGQLAQMLTEAALPLGFKVLVLDPTPNSPAAQAGAEQLVKGYDYAALAELAALSGYLTTEFEEGLDPADLQQLAAKGIKINPHPQTIATILDKLDQKDYLSKNGVTMGLYGEVLNPEYAYQALEKCDKLLIKTRRGGYDGYGNRVVTTREEVDQALKDFEGKPVYWEAFVPFKKELAVMVVRGSDGQIVTYPVVETIQRNNICHEVLAPAAVDDSTQRQATDMAKQVAGLFKGAGAFGVEMFVTPGGKVWLNEIAPRVHNSGHYTIEACETSQFENHIRAITGMGLGPTDLKVPAAAMVNILGEYNGEPRAVDKTPGTPHTYVHIYGKTPNKRGRKMGHITVTGDSVAEAKRTAEQARKEIDL